MAKIKVSKHIIEEMVFGYTDNPIFLNFCEDKGESLEFDISGKDVPEGAIEVEALMNLQRNRAGQQLLSMRFETLKL